MKPLKPWRSFADQLQQLQGHRLQLDDPAAARGYLERLGHYGLSGYWHPFGAIGLAESMVQRKAVRQDSFALYSRFEDVVRRYVFDKKLRFMAWGALERIEMVVRVGMGHLLDQRDPRKNPACLHGNFTKKLVAKGSDASQTQHQVWLFKYHAMLKRARKESFVAHQRQQYGVLSIWATIKMWDCGLLFKVYARVLHTDQQTIAAVYSVALGQAFAQWLRSLNFIHSISAHRSRLWNINVLKLSPIPARRPAALNGVKPFFYFFLLQQWLYVICLNLGWRQRFMNLLADEFPVVAHQAISLSEPGAFPAWEAEALWAQS